MAAELSERKHTILRAIIQNYLETGEPVGSRTLSKSTDLKLSSATIRNEMADLEDLGYIFQPHTSAGRIPSDKGYRLYVDMLMQDKEQELEELKSVMLEKTDRVEKVLKQAAKVLAANTNYATLVSSPVNRRNTLKFIQLSQVDARQIVAVIVMSGNVIKNKIINVGEMLGNETLLKLNMLLNTTLNGMSIEEINLGLIARLKEQAGISTVMSSAMCWMRWRISSMWRMIWRSTQAGRPTYSSIRSLVTSRMHRRSSMHLKRSSSWRNW